MKTIRYVFLVVGILVLLVLLRGCVITTETKAVYAGPWTCGFDEHLGPFKVTVHPAAEYDREPYGSRAIRGIRIALEFPKNVPVEATVSNVIASYVYAPLKQPYEKAEHSMSVLRATRQPGVPDRPMYTIFLQPKDHLDNYGFVREGRYKLDLTLTCEGKTVALVSEVNLAYEKTRSIYSMPLIYLFYLFGAGWHD